ncbi:hypothetical protein ACSFA2_00010 [Variovorax sp. LT2P21]|uniref:hypothetical protein n=1 Tax=Variovorax sp. LT2P21 TaxID=3443731 RepID=UPI003F45FAD9
MSQQTERYLVMPMRFLVMAFAGMLFLSGCAGIAPMPAAYLKPPPLPKGAVANAPPEGSVPPEVAALSGTWSGTWFSPRLKVPAILLVEHLGTTTATVIHSVGETDYTSTRWFRVQAVVGRGTLEYFLPDNIGKAEYRLQPDGTLKGDLNIQGWRSYITLTKVPAPLP